MPLLRVFGLFVRLKDLYIDGLVHISSLVSDYYQFDPMRQRLIGENTKNVYQVGDEVSVKVAAVNLDDRQIDLIMLGDHGKSRKKANRKPLTARERANLEGAKVGAGKSSRDSEATTEKGKKKRGSSSKKTRSNTAAKRKSTSKPAKGTSATAAKKPSKAKRKRK